MKHVLMIFMVFAIASVQVQAFGASEKFNRLSTLCYEPCVVNLKGRVLLVSVAGDANDDYYALVLDKPINVQGRPSSETDMDSYLNIMRVQISSNPFKVPIQPYVGKTVLIKGSLFEANTVHHFTKVLIWVIEIKALPEGKK